MRVGDPVGRACDRVDKRRINHVSGLALRILPRYAHAGFHPPLNVSHGLPKRFLDHPLDLLDLLVTT